MSKNIPISEELAASISAGVSEACGVAFPAEKVRIPARGADAGVPLIGITGLCATGEECLAKFASKINAQSLPAVCGVQPIASARYENGWMLVDFSNGFYSALVSRAIELPFPCSDCRKLALNRMLTARRHSGKGCPDIPEVRQALLLCLCAAEGRVSISGAENAVLSLLDGYAPKERADLIELCGEAADAACRLLYRSYCNY